MSILCLPVCQCLSIQHLPTPPGRPVCGQTESRYFFAVRLHKAAGGPTGLRRPAQRSTVCLQPVYPLSVCLPAKVFPFSPLGCIMDPTPPGRQAGSISWPTRSPAVRVSHGISLVVTGRLRQARGTASNLCRGPGPGATVSP
jgi:hypothetical protein